MNIISYRGPGMAGGVSPALMRLMNSGRQGHRWWFVNEDEVAYTTNGAVDLVAAAKIPQEVIEGHYAYCNNFLWPVMHDLHKYIRFNPEERFLYERFNRIMGQEIRNREVEPVYFIQDYQLALLPTQLVRSAKGPSTSVFWHIPWPKNVPDEYISAITELARALLSADSLGFHRREYAVNFLNFVSENIAGVECNADDLVVKRLESRIGLSSAARYANLTRGGVKQSVGHQTRVIVAPLGLDSKYWTSLSEDCTIEANLRALLKTPYVLSVDRADYTKAVLQRLDAVEAFFDRHPDMIGKLTFAQILVRTRKGLKEFDSYWNDCQKRCKQINQRFGKEDWQPIVNIKPLKSNQLAPLYRHAAMMLVSPLRDGLNLTAKEFIACQTGSPGILALSRKAGVWDEFGAHAVEVDPYHPERMADTIHESLTMSREERALRLDYLMTSLRENGLDKWTARFRELLYGPAVRPQVKIAQFGKSESALLARSS